MKSFICAALVAVAYGQEVESFLQENTFQAPTAATWPVTIALERSTMTLTALNYSWNTKFQTANKDSLNAKPESNVRLLLNSSDTIVLSSLSATDFTVSPEPINLTPQGATAAVAGKSYTGNVGFGNAAGGPFFPGTVWKPTTNGAIKAQVGFAPYTTAVPTFHTLGQAGAVENVSATTSFSNVKNAAGAITFTQYVGGVPTGDAAYEHGVKLAEATTVWEPRVTHFSYDGENLITEETITYKARFALDDTKIRSDVTEATAYQTYIPTALYTSYLALWGDDVAAKLLACDTANVKNTSITLQDDEESSRVVLTWKPKASVLSSAAAGVAASACITSFQPNTLTTDNVFYFEDAIRHFFDVQYDAADRTIKFKANAANTENVLVEGASALSAVVATVAAGVALFAF